MNDVPIENLLVLYLTPKVNMQWYFITFFVCIC